MLKAVGTRQVQFTAYTSLLVQLQIGVIPFLPGQR